MPNINRAAFAAAQLTVVNTALTDIERTIEPAAPSLTPQQRQELPRINVANKAFVEDALNVLGTPAAAAFMPSYISKADLDIDLMTFEQADAMLIRAKRVVTMLEDIRTISGSEAYTSALVTKKMADAAAAAGVNGAAEISRKLGERFEDNGNRGASSDNDATPNP